MHGEVGRARRHSDGRDRLRHRGRVPVRPEPLRPRRRRRSRQSRRRSRRGPGGVIRRKPCRSIAADGRSDASRWIINCSPLLIAGLVLIAVPGARLGVRANMPATSSIRSTRGRGMRVGKHRLDESVTTAERLRHRAHQRVVQLGTAARAANAGAFGLSDMMVRTALPSSALRRNTALELETAASWAARDAVWLPAAGRRIGPHPLPASPRSRDLSPTRFEHAQNRSASRPAAGRADAAPVPRARNRAPPAMQRAPFHAQSGTRRPHQNNSLVPRRQSAAGARSRDRHRGVRSPTAGGGECIEVADAAARRAKVEAHERSARRLRLRQMKSASTRISALPW